MLRNVLCAVLLSGSIAVFSSAHASTEEAAPFQQWWCSQHSFIGPYGPPDTLPGGPVFACSRFILDEYPPRLFSLYVLPGENSADDKLLFRETAHIRQHEITNTRQYGAMAATLVYTVPGLAEHSGVRFAVIDSELATRDVPGSSEVLQPVYEEGKALLDALDQRFAPDPLRLFTGVIQSDDGMELFALNAAERTVEPLFCGELDCHGIRPGTVAAWTEVWETDGRKAASIIHVAVENGWHYSLEFYERSGELLATLPDMQTYEATYENPLRNKLAPYMAPAAPVLRFNIAMPIVE